MTRLSVHLVVVLSLGLFGITGPGFARELPVAPAPRAVEADPFDLTYLPPDCGDAAHPRLLIALRPSVVFTRPDARKAAEVLDEFARMTTGFLGVQALDGPGAAGIDTILLAGHVTVTRNAEDADRPNSLIGFANGAVVRTVEEFDWTAAVKHWYPDAKKVAHAGKTYYTVPVPEAVAQLFPPAAGEAMFAAYVPDGRTLVIAPEASVRKLIDRVKAGGVASKPAGWEDVERAAVALAVEVPDKAVLNNLPGDDVEEAKTAYRIARHTDAAVFGLWIGRTTAVRMTLTTADERAARQVVRQVRKLHPPLDAALRQPPEGGRTDDEAGVVKVLLGLTAAGRVERAGSTVRVTAETPQCLADRLVPMLNGLHPSEPARDR
jgi:hypothetical protein